MSTHVSRHPTTYTPNKTLPITMPPKTPTYNYPIPRAMSPPELSDTPTSYGGSRTSAGSFSARSSYAPSHSSGEYESYVPHPSVDVVDMLSEKMNNAFDPIRMDRSLANQAQT